MDNVTELVYRLFRIPQGPGDRPDREWCEELALEVLTLGELRDLDDWLSGLTPREWQDVLHGDYVGDEPDGVSILVGAVLA